MIRWADLEPYKRSRFGRYVNRCMTRRMEDIRLLGYAVMVVGAWFRHPTLLPGGLLIILFGRLKGKFFSWHLLTNTEEITPEEWQRQPLAELTERTLAALTTSVRRGPKGLCSAPV